MADDDLIELPHQGPARFLRQMNPIEAGEIVGVGVVPRDSPYVVDGAVPAYVALELAAQLAAASAPREGDPGDAIASGYIVRVQSIEILQARLPPDIDWTVRLTPGSGAGGLRTYEADVHIDDREVVRCAFSTYVPRGPRGPGC